MFVVAPPSETVTSKRPIRSGFPSVNVCAASSISVRWTVKFPSVALAVP